MAEPTLSFSDLVTNPDDTLARARENGPVAETHMGPMVVRHQAVRETLQDARLRPSFSRFLQQFGVTSGAFYDWMSRSPLDMEGDEHRRWRKLVERTFTPRSVERLRPFLRAEAHRLIDAFAARGQCEFVDEFARQLPSLGLCELIGVPIRDRVRFGIWADTIGLGFNFVLIGSRIADVDAAITAMLAYAQELIDLRHASPEDDLVTRLAHAAKEEGVSEAVVRGTVAGLVFAGHETTKNQLGWMITLLAGVPALWNEVGREPAKARAVVEEVLRLRSAATSVGRLALRGCRDRRTPDRGRNHHRSVALVRESRPHRVPASGRVRSGRERRRSAARIRARPTSLPRRGARSGRAAGVAHCAHRAPRVPKCRRRRDIRAADGHHGAGDAADAVRERNDSIDSRRRPNENEDSMHKRQWIALAILAAPRARRHRLRW